MQRPLHHLSHLLEAIPLRCHPSPATTPSCRQRIENALYTTVKNQGFDCLRYACWTEHASPTPASQQAFSINLSNFPSAWETVYEQRQYYLVDPVLRAIQEARPAPLIWNTWEAAWHNARQQPIGQDTAEKQNYLSQIQTLAEQACQHGLRSGLYLMACNDSRKLILSLASSQPNEITAQNVSQHLLQELFALMHLGYHALSLTKGCDHCCISLRIDGKDPITLTQAQATILKQFSKNPSATTKDIAQLQHISHNTVNFDLKSLRQKFSKPNASGHVLANIARELGLL